MADTKRIQVTLSNQLLERMDDLCAQLGISRSAYVEFTLGCEVSKQLLSLEQGMYSEFLNDIEIPNPE